MVRKLITPQKNAIQLERLDKDNSKMVLSPPTGHRHTHRAWRLPTWREVSALALALLVSGRHPRTAEEWPESSNIIQGVPGRVSSGRHGDSGAAGPILLPTPALGRPLLLSPRNRVGSGRNHGPDSTRGLLALRVQPGEGEEALLGAPLLERGHGQVVWMALGSFWSKAGFWHPCALAGDQLEGTTIPNRCHPKVPLGSRPSSHALTSCL